MERVEKSTAVPCMGAQTRHPVQDSREKSVDRVLLMTYNGPKQPTGIGGYRTHALRTVLLFAGQLPLNFQVPIDNMPTC